MRILFVTDAVHAGGAEVFVLRLAQALTEAGHSTRVFVLREDLIDRAVQQRVAPAVDVTAPHLPFAFMIRKADGFAMRMRLPGELARWGHAAALKTALRRWQPDVVHSHLLTSDLVAAKALRDKRTPLVVTMHGDYFQYETHDRSVAARLSNVDNAMRQALTAAHTIVCITDEQMRQVERLGQRYGLPIRCTKIYNGSPKPKLARRNVRDELGIPANAIVVGMVGRGIPEKGWDTLVGAFIGSDSPDAHLVLVGAGPALDELRQRVDGARVHFVGQVSDPEDYIASFDIGCLPSRYPAESLPNVIAEYILAGKAVVATRVGEIAQMVGEGENACGILIEVGERPTMVAEMRQALDRLVDDVPLRQQLASNTRAAARKFDMAECTRRYLEVYAAATASADATRSSQRGSSR
jgi:glycosyltransferase involved in cell wall biosynthesis